MNPLVEKPNFVFTHNNVLKYTLVCVEENFEYGFFENISPENGAEESREGWPIECFNLKELKNGYIRFDIKNKFY